MSLLFKPRAPPVTVARARVDGEGKPLRRRPPGLQQARKALELRRMNNLRHLDDIMKASRIGALLTQVRGEWKDIKADTIAVLKEAGTSEWDAIRSAFACLSVTVSVGPDGSESKDADSDSDSDSESSEQ